ncbi:hypothetical protein KKC94_05430 [Patescibacteria group bacterium]|nr:hypothetical protein [Patescibacteria group bacterium]
MIEEETNEPSMPDFAACGSFEELVESFEKVEGDRDLQADFDVEHLEAIVGKVESLILENQGAIEATKGSIDNSSAFKRAQDALDSLCALFNEILEGSPFLERIMGDDIRAVVVRFTELKSQIGQGLDFFK